jgi:phytanoyl-CoA hydroxylase
MALRRYDSIQDLPEIDNDLWVDYQNAVLKQGMEKGLQIKKLYVEPGDSLIWHPQLPHGGSPIKDTTATRMSLVMHTTPVGVPVYHQNAFFNPRAALAEQASWSYKMFDGRCMVNHSSISFGHQKSYGLEQLRLTQPRDCVT